MFWDTDKSEKDNEVVAAAYSHIVDDLGDRRLLLRYLWICLAGLVAAWLSVMAIPNLVYQCFSLIFDLSDKLGIAALGLPFGLGLFTAYCLFRLKFPDIEDNKNLDSEIMASFNYQSDSTKRWFIWLFSILFGVINVILLILTTLFLSDQT